MTDSSCTARVALITGGARGIGRGIAEYLLARDWCVAVLDIDAEALDELAQRFEAARLLPLSGSIGDEQAVRLAFERVTAWHARLDLLVNNAGPADPDSGPLEALSLEGWHSWLDTHLTGAFLCSRSAVPLLREWHGSIVNIASTRALQSEPDSEAYAASKGGLLALTHAMSVSLGPEIRVNAICPGWIEVGEHQQAAHRQPPEHRAIDHHQHPAGRIGEPADIAALVAFLASPEAGFITGQHFPVDGGMTRRMIYAD
ncbi:NAD(P)-dependent dehydrogenase (short-subunit alcohol dehydrogenase family) [Kushneria sinocarnis]|uniref:NAD(P)-dependent dehydrogenase (Short-subunit alcohol dehydrogenase family) n=1 Tax=Kushneria sinocarnis TaxID=595502 RepID=A0A420X0Q6_9GAMM|nr:SDR family oxidoreductase [Kushneria sinocarnis]RKR07433.1 NAD(P)-dependent dehydrogenase (short-subunit alcohol dehydrogenase family) [Kushneria sinocarnis]